MPEQTSVTKGPVSESGQNQSQSQGQGQDQIREIENRVRENLRAEYGRKESDLAQKLEATQNRMAELEELSRMSQAQLAEYKRLQSSIPKLEEEINIIETDPGYAAFREKLHRESVKTQQETANIVMSQFYQNEVEALVDDAAEEMGVDPEKLYEELQPFALPLLEKVANPIQRTRRALKAYKAESERKANYEKLLKQKEEAETFAESGGRAPRQMTYKEAKESGTVLDRIRSLGKY